MPAVRTWTRQTSGALLLGGVHVFVDAASGFVIFRDVGGGPFDHQAVVVLVVLYNTLAFGGQSVAGLLADWLNGYRAMAVAGAALAAVALLLGPHWTVAAIVIVGVGNALFHVGAGADVLRSTADRSTESGVFVGPGALGLCAGIWAGGHDLPYFRAGLVLALLLTAPLTVPIARASLTRVTQRQLPRVKAGLLLVAVVCAACLVGSVTVRSLIGGTVAGTWRGISPEVMVGLAAAACCGKMLGGFIGDRVGWITTSVAALVISAPLMSFWVGSPVGAVVGMLVFQLTMPMTLKATHHLMPTRPGLAFGIPCLALLIGALPGLLGFGGYLQPWPVVLTMIVFSAAMVGVGLGLLRRLGASPGPR